MAQIKYLDSRRIMGESDGTDIAPTFEDDFSSDNWTDSDSAKMGVQSGYLYAYGQRDGSNDSSSRSLGTTLNGDFVFRTKVDITSWSAGSVGYGKGVIIGLSNQSNTASDSTAQDSVSISISARETNGDGFYAYWSDNQGMSAGGSTRIGSLAISTGIRYFEIIKNGTTVTYNIYSDKYYSTLVATASHTSVTATGFTYAVVRNENGTASTQSGYVEADIDDWEVFAGVTSVTAGKPNVKLSLSGCKAYYNFEQTGTPIANTSGSTNFNVYSANQYAGGVAVFNTSSTLYNQTMNTMTFYIRKTGSPTGTGECRVYNGGTLQATSSNTIDVSTLTTDYTPQKFTFSTPYTIQSGDDIIFYYTGGDGTNYTSMHGSNTNVYDSTNTGWVRNVNGSWERLNTYDMKFTLNEVSLENIATTANGFTDGLGSSADGTNNGATTGSTGKVGSYAYSFDGTNDTVQLGSSYSDLNFLHDGSSWSIAFWFKDDNSSQTSRIFSTMDDRSGSQRGISLVHDTTGFNLGVYTGSAGQYPFASTISSVFTDTNTWHHYVLTFTTGGSTATLYKDGSSFGTWTKTGASFNTSNATKYPYIASRFNYDSFMGGDIDEFVIFNRALTSSEVSTLYNSGTGVAVNDSSITAKPETNSIFVETDTATRYWFDGSEWIIPYLAGADTGFSAGGSTSLWTANTNHETYNGSTWSSATALTAGRQRITGVGGSSNHLVAGGDSSGTTNTQTTTYVWNGSSWSTGGALSQKRQFNPIGGTTTNTIVMGGETPETSQPNQINSVESYNGTSWTTEASMSASSSGHSGSGTRLNAWWAGGYTHPNYISTSQEYNGTAWTTRTSLPAIRSNNAGGIGWKDSSLVAGGYDGVSNYQTTTYFYNGTAWSTKGAFPIASAYVHMGGNPDNTLQTSGYYSTWYQTNAYKFNGSTWSSTGSRSTGTTTGACGGG